MIKAILWTAFTTAAISFFIISACGEPPNGRGMLILVALCIATAAAPPHLDIAILIKERLGGDR